MTEQCLDEDWSTIQQVVQPLDGELIIWMVSSSDSNVDLPDTGSSSLASTQSLFSCCLDFTA